MRKLFKSTTILMFILIFTLSSCKKNKQEESEEIKNTNSSLQLLKWTSWNSVSSEEQFPTVFTYDEQGHIKTLSRGGYSYTPTYTNGKLTKLKTNTATGGEISYTMEYNTLGQMTKVVFVFMNPNDQGFTKTFAYNANGKVSRTVNLNTDYAFYNPQTEDFEWNGDNITKKTYSSIVSPTPDVTEYLSYDDKLNPFSLGDVFPIIINGAPVSKNNYLTYKWTNNVTNYYERVFTYNVNGYPNSVYIKQSPTSGTKFYYNK